MPRLSLTERFWKNVEHKGPNECWPWTAGRTNGYGIFYISKGIGQVMAHRVAWFLTHGKIPDGLFVCHDCDYRRCCNPTHLFLGTNEDNIRDMAQKGRARNKWTVKTLGRV